MGSQNCVFKSMLEISSCLSDTLTVMISACLVPSSRGFLGEAGPSGLSREQGQSGQARTCHVH